MEIEINGNKYNVEIVRKNNHNTYIRVKKGIIYVSTSFFMRDGEIKRIINDNIVRISKLIDKDKREYENDDFYYFGKKYHIVYGFSATSFEEGIIYTSNEVKFMKYINDEIKKLFLEHLMKFYNEFSEDIPKPTLKIRKMSSRWGVCNTKSHNITLNYNLIRYDIRCLDYVIVHELCHLVYPNHSASFWALVGKYCSNYKEIRKILRD